MSMDLTYYRCAHETTPSGQTCISRQTGRQESPTTIGRKRVCQPTHIIAISSRKRACYQGSFRKRPELCEGAKSGVPTKLERLRSRRGNLVEVGSSYPGGTSVMAMSPKHGQVRCLLCQKKKWGASRPNPWRYPG